MELERRTQGDDPRRARRRRTRAHNRTRSPPLQPKAILRNTAGNQVVVRSAVLTPRPLPSAPSGDSELIAPAPTTAASAGFGSPCAPPAAAACPSGDSSGSPGAPNNPEKPPGPVAPARINHKSTQNTQQIPEEESIAEHGL